VAGWVEEGGGDHAYIRYEDVRIPKDNMLGDRGQAFVVARTRLAVADPPRDASGGPMKLAFEMLCERAVSRFTQGERLSSKQLRPREWWPTRGSRSSSFRLLVLQTAWKIDRYGDYKRVRGDISAVKVAAPKVLQSVATKALQVHGSLAISDEMPFVAMLVNGIHVGLADGPTEVHKLTLARQILAGVEPTSETFPSRHIPALKEEAERKYAATLARL